LGEKMPIVICKYCDYVGQGQTLEEKWDDAEKHEKSQHKKELKEDSE
jgi:hypothetical protein